MRITKKEEKNYKLAVNIIYGTKYKYGEYAHYEPVDVDECSSIRQCLEKAHDDLVKNPSLFNEMKDGVSIELHWEEEK